MALTCRFVSYKHPWSDCWYFQDAAYPVVSLDACVSPMVSQILYRYIEERELDSDSKCLPTA